MTPTTSATAAGTLDHLVAVAAHIEAELDEALSEVRLSRPSFQVLQVLAAAPETTLTQRDLVASVRRTAGTMSVRLGRLERAGMITREAHPDDRRAARVSLTDRGRELLEKARPLYEERAQVLADALPEKALAQLDEHVTTWLQFFEPKEHDAPTLGIAVAPSAVANRMRRAVGLPHHPGVLVVGVKRDGPAAAAGVMRGDLITEAGGIGIRTTADLERAVKRVTKSLTLKLLRGADPHELTVGF